MTWDERHGRHCLFPFHTLYVGEDHLATCCPLWIARSGVLWKRDLVPGCGPWDIWNHRVLQDLRRDVLARRWSLCERCVQWKIGRNSVGEFPADCQPVMERGPRVLFLSDDRTCNLHCWSCREKPYTDRAPAAAAELRERLLAAWLPDLEVISLLHSGDPFASPYYRRWLARLDPAPYPRLRIELFTNGLLLPANWAALRGLHDRICRVMISVDAGTAATYARVRGARWDELLACLDLLDGVRRDRGGPELWLNMTVRAASYRDIPAFCDLGRRYRAERIELKPLLRWWQTGDEWRAHAICEPSHPAHADYVRVLADTDLTGVDAGQLG